MTLALALVAQAVLNAVMIGMIGHTSFRLWQVRGAADFSASAWEKQSEVNQLQAKVNERVVAVLAPRDPAHQLVIDRDDAEKAVELILRVANSTEAWMYELHDIAALLTPDDTGAPGTPYATVRRRQDGQPW